MSPPTAPSPPVPTPAGKGKGGGALDIAVLLLPRFVLEHWVLGLGKHGLDDLATIIFSSGSTGEPKGVMLSHGNVMANVESMIQVISLAADDRILGVLPFTLALPYADFFWTNVAAVVIGLVISSAFPAIVVFAQELVPGRVGLVAGIFFGLAFGFGGIGAAMLGVVADYSGIDFVFWICSFLPLFGLLTAFLPDMKGRAI